MTKEPIMIDGIDVSGCKFTLERDGKIKCECTHATGFGVICDCESWKTCDYKNYKRKEKEINTIIDRLLKQFETYDKLKSLDVITFAKQTFEQLDQLKEKNKWYDHYKESALRNKELYNDLSTKYDQLKAECEKWKNNYHKSTAKMTIKEIDQSTYIKQLERTINGIRTERDNYKQALLEIKEIAQGYKPYKVCGDYKNNCEPINEILQKCEVIRVENEKKG